MEKKYLKYKNKYLNLKKQIGGFTIPNITKLHNYYKNSELYKGLQEKKEFNNEFFNTNNNNLISFNIKNEYYNESFEINNK